MLWILLWKRVMICAVDTNNKKDANNHSQLLLDHFNAIDEHAQSMVVEFAEYLTTKYPAEISKANEHELPDKPLDIERPTEESVIKAIRRLSRTYPMVDKSQLFDKTSSLMTDHVMKGRDVVSVIDELETVFLQAYNNK